MSELSQKQLEANRQNAKLGGPKTHEGKEASKMNALKHGILSKEVLLEGEDEETLTALGKRLRAELKPVGEMELLLAERIVSNVWRLKRMLWVEKNAMEWQRDYKELELLDDPCKESDGQKKRKRIKFMIANDQTEKILRYETSIERGIYKALHELQRIQSIRIGEKPPMPIAVDIDLSSDREKYAN